MGRHSRTDASGPETEPSRWGGLRQRTDHDDTGTESAHDDIEPIGAGNGSSGPAPAATTALLPIPDQVRRPGPVGSGPAGDVLTRPNDQTQIIPRVPAAATSTWPATPDAPAPKSTPKPAPAAALPAPPSAPARPSGPAANDETAVFARPVLDEVDANGAATAEPATESTAAPEESSPAADDAEDPDYTRYVHDSPTSHQRWMWPALVVFWLLALGAGIITLASLGAPHYLCTGAAKGLACHQAGTAIAAVLTVLVIAVVGVVSVLAIEARRRGLAWLRHLGIGIVVLAVVAGGGYLLIRTIGG